jgi:hypothetical protein
MPHCLPAASQTLCLSMAPELRLNMALNLAPFGRWTLRDNAAQRRLALR